MKSSLLKLFTVVVISIMSLPLMGQKGIEDGSKYGHNEDSANCRKNLSLYKTYYNQENFDMALGFWRMVINECPRSSKNAYIHGVRMYKALYEQTGDRAYVDSLIYVYDTRIKFFGEKAEQEGRKGMDLWNLGSDHPELLQLAYTTLDKALETEPFKADPNVLMIYMAASQKLFEIGTLTNEDVINNYGRISEILDTRIERANRPPDVGAKENIDAIFKAGGAGTCDGLIGLFTDKVKASPGDIGLLKQVLGLLNDAGCNDSDLYYQAAENLYRQEKSALAAYSLAEMNAEKLNYDQAEIYYNEAIKMEEDPIKKANYYIKMSTIRLSKQDNQKARDYAKEAISLDPGNGTAYMLVGNAYAGQKISDKEIENQAVYWVAVDYFKQAIAKNPDLAERINNMITQCEKVFPEKKELFFEGIMDEGIAYRVGGWINESTTVRFRKE
jgi:tetratricopeptide (TPR) repeat protein